MDATEILEHERRDLAKWLSADGNDVPQHELDDAVERLLPISLAGKLSNAMRCAQLAAPYFDERYAERAERQLWNW
jgi:hypothetical protein